MARAATDRLKVNPPLGLMPALQYLLPAQLEIDPAYQRSLDASSSQALIRKIAQFWNWDLCQPLVVARRENGALFVIDGQHRLAAARLRGDIAQLPAVVVQYASTADEAASFVHLNQQRRPLGKLDLFKAAVASGDGEAAAIAGSLIEAGLSLANTTNPDVWKPGQLVNIAGIERCWRRQGSAVARLALRALAKGFEGQVLRYGGTIFPGVAAIFALPGATKQVEVTAVAGLLASKEQAAWRTAIIRQHGTGQSDSIRDAAAQLLVREWKATGAWIDPSPPPADSVEIKFKAEKGWCDQCDAMVTRTEAEGCKSRHCAVKVAKVAA